MADEHRLAGEVGGNDGKGGGGAVSDDDDDDDGNDDDNDGDNSGNDDDDEVPFQRYDADGNERYSGMVLRCEKCPLGKLMGGTPVLTAAFFCRVFCTFA